MKKVALVYVLAVLVPSLVLAWLAVRSLRDQQFLLERQQSLLYQGAADTLAKRAQDTLADYERAFVLKVDALLKDPREGDLTRTFDDELRKDWPLAKVGFVVTSAGVLTCPSPYTRPDAKAFAEDNGRFLVNRESAEVYWNPKQVLNSSAYNNAGAASSSLAPSSLAGNDASANWNARAQTRNVVPQQQAGNAVQVPLNESPQQLSKVISAPAEFRQLIGEDRDGTLARFVDNKLNVLLWYRPPGSPNLVFGAQLAIPKLVEGLQYLVEQSDPALRQDICIAVLDDSAKPVILSQPGFKANWKRPFVATELGEALPHWEVALYLLDPSRLTASARTLEFTLGFLIALLVLAIGMGSWLVAADLNRQLTLARQKTDFVSNVSHELKTPLTSIRMFAELLAEDRVQDAGKRRTYLGIITAETARLTRLINNVLDFARLERGEKKYHLAPCDLGEVAREAAESYRPHLEANGFKFDCRLPSSALPVNGDRDALAQVLVNLLSNAEKYSDSHKEIVVETTCNSEPLPYGEIKVSDRGLGVPKGSEEKIFEKFYRAHDSLASGIQGSGLGLPLARQVARAHGGEVIYAPRPGGGSCFTLRLPLAPEESQLCKPKS